MERRVTIEEEGIYREDYQVRMLQANQIEGILKIKGRGADGRSYYDYDVSGKISLKALYERNEIKAEDMKKFLERLLFVINETEKYMLNIHRILLEPENIYYEDGEYYFCYYPSGKDNLWEKFHILTEYLVKRADYKDQKCVQMIFLLHKETMEENYSLEKLVEQCLRIWDTENVQRNGRVEQDIDTEIEEEEKYEYDTSCHDWITEQEMGTSIMDKTENMWTPVKKFLSRHKKPRWGDWDGLYIEEEEL